MQSPLPYAAVVFCCMACSELSRDSAAFEAALDIDEPSNTTPRSNSLNCRARSEPYPSPLPTPSATATRVLSGYLFLEGPVWLPAQGSLYMTDTDFETSTNPDGPDSKIWRFTPPSTVELLAPEAAANGLALANDGRVLAATQDTQSLAFFDPNTGERDDLRLRYRGQRFNSPNDLAVRSDGSIYFTDPDYAIGPRISETRLYGVYRVSPRGRVSLVDGRVNRPNGIALSPDERTLYVGGREPAVYKYQLDDRGDVVGERTVLTEEAGESDGFTIDCAGNLYVTSTTVKVFDPTGALLGEIVAGEFATNVAFGGPNQTTLYITSYGELYAIDLNVPGRAY
ncbi:MAG TPA: SMP-30/gluconolactonase/LRE family protein [Polyangiales bacterium]|nr:SMP-30/gluconolactonase/LRE family protein [Polyangiales bacterium]